MIIFLLLYIVIMIYKYGIPTSISETYYSLKHKYWFGFTMIITAITLFISLIDVVNMQFLLFLSCVGLIFVGIAPNFKESFERPVHVTGAVLSLMCSQLLIAFNSWTILLLWIPYLLFYYFIKNKLFWAEVISFTTIFLLTWLI